MVGPCQQHRLTHANWDYTVDTLSKPAAPQRGLFNKSSVNGLQHRQRCCSPDRGCGEPTRSLNLLHYGRLWRLCWFEPAGTDSGWTGQLKTFCGPILHFSQGDDRLLTKSTFWGWRQALYDHRGVRFCLYSEKWLSINCCAMHQENIEGGDKTSWTLWEGDCVHRFLWQPARTANKIFPRTWVTAGCILQTQHGVNKHVLEGRKQQVWPFFRGVLENMM